MITVKKTHSSRELVSAFDIREQVFVLEQGVPQEEEYDAHEQTATHFLAMIKNEPCGTARWRFTADGIKLERFAVLPPFRNKQVGSLLLREVLADVLPHQNGKPIYLHAQLRAVPFYERHGFRKVGPEFSECNIRHYKMVYAPEQP